MAMVSVVLRPEAREIRNQKPLLSFTRPRLGGGLRRRHPDGALAPKGWLVESDDGRRDVAAPWLADFGLVECPDPGYPARTRANVRDSDATLWFGSYDTPGFRTTHDAAIALNRPFQIVYNGITKPSQVVAWIGEKGVKVLNVAGNRESTTPGIGERVERFMREVFRRLAAEGLIAARKG